MTDQISKNEAKEILTSDIASVINEYSIPSKEITYSKNIFLPLTHICQNNCGYCTFKESPENTKQLVMDEKKVMQTVIQAKKHSCTEAMFAFGESADKNPEVLNQLNNYGYESMVDYVYDLSEKILTRHEMLPHTNMGIITRPELERLSQVNASMGLMLETTNKKLMKTIVHRDSPGKNPEKRLQFIKNAGKEKIPFTTGLLIGIGESTDDHIESLYQIRKIQDKYHHIQEIIIQNFKSKPGIPMENHPEPEVSQLLNLTILASKMFPDVSIQIPPNLNRNMITSFIKCGADDLGGVSPVTKDYVNPEDEWPSVRELEKNMKNINCKLKERLPVYDKFIKKEYLKEKVYEKTIKLQKQIN